MSSGGKTQTVTQTSGPWGGQQPYLSDAFQIARQNLDAASRPSSDPSAISQYYPGATYTPASRQTNVAMDALYNSGTAGGATNGIAGNQAAGVQGANLLNNGAGALAGSANLSAGQGLRASGLAGFNGVNYYSQNALQPRGLDGGGTIGYYADNALQSRGIDGGGTIGYYADNALQARGLDGGNTIGQYADRQANAAAIPGGNTLAAFSGGAYSGANPYFNQMVQQSLDAARPAIDSAFASSGRLGGGARANAIADSATRTAGQLGYQNYGDSLQRQLGAAGQLSQNQMALQGQQIGAAGMLSDTQRALQAQQLGAAGALSDTQRALQAQQLGAAGLLSNTQQNLQAQQIGASNAINQTDLAAQQAGLGASQTLNQQQLAAQGLGGQLAGQAAGFDQQNIGNIYNAGQQTENYQNQALQDNINRFNYYQNLPWNNLANYIGIVNGNYGGSSTTTQPVYGNSALSTAFGALGATGSLLGGAGALGAGLGGLGGLLGATGTTQALNGGQFAFNRMRL